VDLVGVAVDLVEAVVEVTVVDVVVVLAIAVAVAVSVVEIVTVVDAVVGLVGNKPISPPALETGPALSLTAVTPTSRGEMNAINVKPPNLPGLVEMMAAAAVVDLVEAVEVAVSVVEIVTVEVVVDLATVVAVEVAVSVVETAVAVVDLAAAVEVAPCVEAVETVVETVTDPTKMIIQPFKTPQTHYYSAP